MRLNVALLIYKEPAVLFLAQSTQSVQQNKFMNLREKWQQGTKSSFFTDIKITHDTLRYQGLEDHICIYINVTTKLDVWCVAERLHYRRHCSSIKHFETIHW